MGRNAEIETDRDVLKRIVALLFAFADLAHRASGRSYPVRCLVLWFLRRAEAVARDWVAADSADDMETACAVLHRNSRAEAMHLAHAFRALAYELRSQLRLEERLSRRLMRGKVNRAATGARRRGLLALYTLRRLAWAMRATMQCLRSLGFEAAPRLDTS